MASSTHSVGGDRKKYRAQVIKTQREGEVKEGVVLGSLYKSEG